MLEKKTAKQKAKRDEIMKKIAVAVEKENLDLVIEALIFCTFSVSELRYRLSRRDTVDLCGLFIKVLGKNAIVEEAAK